MIALRAWVLLALAVVVLAGNQVWLSHLRYEVSLKSQRLLVEQTTIKQQTRALSLEIASLTRPDRLREYARKLGMGPPRPMQVLHP